MIPEKNKPDWWKENDRIRQQMELPSYDPPRFSDGVYVHEVVSELESEHDCQIRFIGKNTKYGDDWNIYIDEEPVSKVGKHRNENANTVYEIDSSEFRSVVTTEL